MAGLAGLSSPGPGPRSLTLALTLPSWPHPIPPAGPRVALAQAQGVRVLLPSDVEGEGQRRGGLKASAKALGRDDRASGISLWKLLRDSSAK